MHLKMSTRCKPNACLAVALVVLVVTGDAGVEALRASTLHADAPYVSDHAAADGIAAMHVRHNRLSESVEEGVSLGSMRFPQNRMQTEAEREASTVAAPIEAAHVVAAPAFADTTLVSKDSAAQLAEVQIEPVMIMSILGAACGFVNLLLSLATASRKAKASFLHESFGSDVSTIISDAHSAMSAVAKIYEETAGDLDRRVADLVRDTGLTVVQFMSGSELHDTAVALTAADSNPNTKGMKAADAPFDAAADPVMAPLAAAAAAYAKAGPEGKAAAAETLRGALFRLLSSDYAAMGSSFGKDADKTLYVVDKKAMAPVFAYALSQLADGGDGGDAEVRELEEALADQALRGSRASARLSGSGSGLAKLGSEKALSNELAVKAGVAGQEIDKPSSGSDFAAAVEKLNGVYGKVNMGYGIVLAAAGNVGKLGGPAKPVADGVLAVTAKINAVKVYVDAVSTVMSTVVNVIHLAKADGLVGAEIFEGSRGSMLASERAPQLYRRALASACNTFSAMRVSLAAAIEARVVDALKTVNEPNANPAAPVMDLTSVLGFGKGAAEAEGAWKLTLGTRQRISATLVARLCGIFTPLLERVNSLFRPKGECKQLVEYGWQLTGAPDVSTPAATADLKMELTAVAAPNFVPVHADFKYSAGNALRKGDGVPGRDGCLNSNGGDADGDIWDVQIVSGAALPEFVAAGYKVAQDADVTWAGVQPGDTSVTVSRFEGEINAWMGKWKTTPAVPPYNSLPANSRKLVTLTCAAMRHYLTENKLKPESTAPFMPYFTSLTAPVSDILISTRNPMDASDSLLKSSQSTLRTAGYQLLRPRRTLKDQAVPLPSSTFAEMLADTAPEAPDLAVSQALLTDANIKQGRSEKKALTFLHVLRGGSMPLTQLVIAPFVGVMAGTSPKQTETFLYKASVAFTKQQADAAAKLAAAQAKKGSDVVVSSIITIAELWNTQRGPLPPSLDPNAGVPSPLVVGGDSFDGDSKKQVAPQLLPPGCAGALRFEVKSARSRAFTWWSQKLRRVRASYGLKEKAENVQLWTGVKAEVACDAATVGAQMAWERVGSLYPVNTGEEARTLKPFLWAKRRFALPPFGGPVIPAARCADECAPAAARLYYPRQRTALASVTAPEREEFKAWEPVAPLNAQQESAIVGHPPLPEGPGAQANNDVKANEKEQDKANEKENGKSRSLSAPPQSNKALVQPQVVRAGTTTKVT